MKKLLHSNDRCITVRNKCVKISLSSSVHFAAHAEIACCSSELIFMYLCKDSSIQNMSKQFVSCIPLFFCKLHFSSYDMNKKSNRVRSWHSNMAISVTSFYYTHFYRDFFSLSDWYYHLPKYWPFHPNLPVWYKSVVTSTWSWNQTFPDFT